jgi:Ribbon-helix-helix protein, copG family
MRSLRLEPELDDRVRRAADAEGSSVSEFLRRAAAERADRTLSERNSDRLADVIGVVHGQGRSRARDTGAAFADILTERRRTR